MSNSSTLEKFLEICLQEKLCRSKEDLRFYLHYLFDGVDLKGKRVLDIGAGPGTYGLYAAIMGASDVVCLEPEDAGSRTGFIAKFNKIKADLGLQKIEMEAKTFQDYQSANKKFDLILLHHSINHLDEPACITLLDSAKSQKIYQGLFQELINLSAPGGSLLITDAARQNFYPAIHVKNPFVRTIEWHKHQQPETWVKHLSIAGFKQPKVSWTSPSQLREFGRFFFGNKLASYFLHSHFKLLMKKP